MEIADTLLDCYSFGDLIECLDNDLGFDGRHTAARNAYAGMLRRRRAAEQALNREAASLPVEVGP